MSSGAKLAVLLGAAVVAAVAFVLLRPASGGGPQSAPATSTQGAEPAPAAPVPGGQEPAVATIRVSDGEPVGGMRNLAFKEGGTIRFRVTADAGDEVHLHGYDVEKPVGPGRAASFSVPATITGRFEVELHENATPIAEVTVEP